MARARLVSSAQSGLNEVVHVLSDRSDESGAAKFRFQVKDCAGEHKYMQALSAVR